MNPPNEMTPELQAALTRSQEMKSKPRPSGLPSLPLPRLDVYFKTVEFVCDGKDGTNVTAQGSDTTPFPPELGSVTITYRFTPPLQVAGDVPYRLRFWEQGRDRADQTIQFGMDALVAVIRAKVARRHRKWAKTWLTLESAVGIIGQKSTSVALGASR